jgi:hypothetical protein
MAQVGAQVLDAPLTVAGILRMHYALLPELLNDLADLLQASVQKKQAFIARGVVENSHLVAKLYLMYTMDTRCANGKYIRHLLYILADAPETAAVAYPLAPEKGAAGKA